MAWYLSGLLTDLFIYERDIKKVDKNIDTKLKLENIIKQLAKIDIFLKLKKYTRSNSRPNQHAD